MAVPVNTVVDQFCSFYYDVFDKNRADLAPLYRANSILSFEGHEIQGVEAIIEKLKGLPFAKIQHHIVTKDPQPAAADGSIACLITGALLTDEEQKPMSFTQFFQLKPESGSYYVGNDIFRMVYPASDS